MDTVTTILLWLAYLLGMGAFADQVVRFGVPGSEKSRTIGQPYKTLLGAVLAVGSGCAIDTAFGSGDVWSSLMLMQVSQGVLLIAMGYGIGSYAILTMTFGWIAKSRQAQELQSQHGRSYNSELINLPESRSRLTVLLVLSILAAVIALIFSRN